MAFAIFTDSNSSFHPRTFEQSFLGTSLFYKFNTYKVVDQPEAALVKNSNPFALVVLTVQTALNGREMKDEELYRLKMELVRRLYASGINPDKIRKIMVFLRFYVRFENSKLMNNFDKEIAVFTKNRESMGIEEFLLDRAKKEGIQETLNKVISQLLTKQFSPEQIAEMLDVPVSFVLSIKEEDTENE